MASSANFFLLAAAAPTLPSLLFLDKQARLDVYKIRVIHFKPQQKQVLFHVQTICLAIAADGCVIQQRAKSSLLDNAPNYLPNWVQYPKEMKISSFCQD